MSKYKIIYKFNMLDFMLNLKLKLNQVISNFTNRIPIFFIITGGLGNQLFMFSYAYSVAIKKNRKLFLIGNWFNSKQRDNLFSQFTRTFDLSKYPKIKDEYLLKSKAINLIIYKIFRISLRIPKIFKSVGIINIDTHNLDQEKLFILSGYGHKPTEFINNKVEVLKLITPEKKTQDYADKYIKSRFQDNKKLVALHIRRGDFVIPGNFSNVLKLSYYNDCIDQFKSNNAVFLIFSDDIVWCKQQFIDEKFFFVEENDPIVSLAISSFCVAYILSASSYSWWMAWTSKSPTPQVFFPLEQTFSHTDLGKAFENNSWKGVETIFEVEKLS